MGNIAYIITRGCYSDYEICAVTLNKDRAERLKQLYSNRIDEAEIEEWELDKGRDEDKKLVMFYKISIERYINANETAPGKKESDKVNVHKFAETENYLNSAYCSICNKKRTIQIQKTSYGYNRIYFEFFITENEAGDEEKAKKIAYDVLAEEIAMRMGV